MDRTTRREIASAEAHQSQGPYTLTVYVAAPGTPVVSRDGQSHTSAAGHVYYSVSNGRSDDGYGFSPIVSGVRGPGHIVRNEHRTYQNPAYARTLEITPQQYHRLHEFGEAAANRKAGTFDLYYNGAANSCIDFTWKALEHAGLKRGLRLAPGASVELPNGYEGALKPLDNIHEIERLAPPVPASPLNREERHPLPNRTLLQRMISENEIADPATPRPVADGRSVPQDPRLQQIRDGVHRLDAAAGRTPDETSERLVAGLFAAVARTPGLERIDDVVLSQATAGHPAGRMAFAVHRPFGDREPVFHAAVDVQQALAQPAEEHHRQAVQALREQDSQLQVRAARQETIHAPIRIS